MGMIFQLIIVQDRKLSKVLKLQEAKDLYVLTVDKQVPTIVPPMQGQDVLL